MAAAKKKEAKPSPRLVALAGLVSGGMPMEAAMAQAGYGPGAIAGLAPEMAGVLEKAGLASRPTRAARTPAAESKET